jgi:hypothetical protein
LGHWPASGRCSWATHCRRMVSLLLADGGWMKRSCWLARLLLADAWVAG